MEDMGVQIPAYDDRTVATPNLDQLAADGIIFERAHVSAASCASSRGTLLVGFTHIRMESWDLSSSMGFTIAMVLRPLSRI